VVIIYVLMPQRKQKNLRLDEEYHEKLEKMALEMFNSKKKQGQVVERLIDLHSDTDMIGMIEDIHSEVVESNKTHTQSTEVDDTDDVPSELREKVENREPVDPDEFDFSVFKGDTEMVVNAGISILKHKNPDKITKKQVMKLVQKEFGYSVNAARQKRDMILDELRVYDDDVLEKLMDDELRHDLHKNKNGSQSISAPPSDEPKKSFRNKYRNLKQYTATEIDFDSMKYSINPDKTRDVLCTMLSTVKPNNRQIEARINELLDKINPSYSGDVIRFSDL